VAFVPCTGFLFSWFVVGIVEDDMWGAWGVEEQATDFYLKTRAGSTSKMPCAFQIQIRSSVQYTTCVMSKQLYILTDNELMKGLDMCVYALHKVRSRASSFKWEYSLLSLSSSSSFLRLLPCLPVTSIAFVSCLP
jgi:hypothetical protein